jgi:hypothetical protein
MLGATIVSKLQSFDKIKSRTGRLSEEEIGELGCDCPDGLTLWEVIEIVKSRISGDFTEATFRSYIQRGLVSGSISRVGQKGKKHCGSHGIYPIEVINQIVRLKEYLSDDRNNITIEFLAANPDYTCQQLVTGAKVILLRVLADLDNQIAGQSAVPEDLADVRGMARKIIEQTIGSSREAISALDKAFLLSLTPERQ